MTDVSELRAVVESVATAFQREDVTYFISGSLASSVHGEFRATNGVDIVVGDEVSEVQRRDIESLVVMNRETLDRAYLNTWSETLVIRDLLDRFWG